MVICHNYFSLSSENWNWSKRCCSRKTSNWDHIFLQTAAHYRYRKGLRLHHHRQHHRQHQTDQDSKPKNAEQLTAANSNTIECKPHFCGYDCWRKHTGNTHNIIVTIVNIIIIMIIIIMIDSWSNHDHDHRRCHPRRRHRRHHHHHDRIMIESWSWPSSLPSSSSSSSSSSS